MFDRMRYIVRKLFDLKQQIHVIEAETSLPLPAVVIGHAVALMLDLYSEGRYSSMCVLICGELYKGPAHIQMVVNYVNFVNMYIQEHGLFSHSPHTCVEPRARA